LVLKFSTLIILVYGLFASVFRKSVKIVNMCTDDLLM